MTKMYLAEVLGKLPVIQHFFFGSILPYQGISMPSSSDQTEHAGHTHAKGEMGWGDCCGIPVPSAFAAAQSEKAQGGVLPIPGIFQSGLVRPVPFD
jgi:serine/threonine-protein phosphatase 2A activator